MGSKYIRRRALIKSKWDTQTHPILKRIYAGRGIKNELDIDKHLANMLPPHTLGGLSKAVDLLADAILQQKSIMVSGDYDCDGATGTTVAVRGLRMLGATKVNYIIPDRFKQGYGLTPSLVEAMVPQPDVIVTVDSGVASNDGVRVAKEKGITVIVTDHHLPPEVLPQADAMVNPNLNGDAFPSKALAGVGVIFYLLLATRVEITKRGKFTGGTLKLSSLLDLVALGTVADMVPLDRNNRILVEAGLKRIREGRAHVGINALINSSGRRIDQLVATDIGFNVAPKLNAAGRLENMRLGVEALLTDDPNVATEYVKELTRVNQERRDLQARMTEEAENMVSGFKSDESVGIVVYNPSWHAGVVGLVASKLKENLHRPVIAFAAGEDGSDELRGSGRSISGFHLRDALAFIDAKHPGLIMKFGGHAMAAGLSLKRENLSTFTALFDQAAAQSLTEEDLDDVVLSDGELTGDEISLETAELLNEAGPWGQAFPEPQFDGIFEVTEWTVLKDLHLKLILKEPKSGFLFKAIAFFGFSGEDPPSRMRCVYQLTIDQYRQEKNLKLIVRYFEKA